MSMLKRPVAAWMIAAFAVIAIGIAVSDVSTAQAPAQLRAFAGGPAAGPLSEDLPPVARGPMNITPDTRSGRALSVLSFDDGSCEGGLGAGTTVTDLVDFDVPTQCSQAGLDIVGVTGRMNTGNAQNFAFGQAGATPPAAGAATLVPITPIAGIGACPGSPTALEQRAVGPGAAVITDTTNFFAGHQNTGFAGRDTNSAPAGRIWLLCGTCTNTTYSPTALTGLGLGGNWMIRVTVEDQNCIPVELMDFTVADG